MSIFLFGLGIGAGCGGEDTTSAITPPASNPPQAARSHGREVKGGRVHQGGNLSISPTRSLNAVDVLPLVKDELKNALGPLTASDFATASQHVERTPARATLSHVSYRQVRDGVPIHGTYLNLTLRADGSGGSKLSASSHHLYQDAVVDTQDHVGEERAHALARRALRAQPDAPVANAEKVIRPIAGALQMVWDISFTGRYERVLVIANGPSTGRILTLDDRVFEVVTGSVSGHTVSGGAPGASGTVAQTSLPHTRVTGPGTMVNADAAGVFSVDVPLGSPLQASLNGRAATVENVSGPNLLATGAAAPGVGLVFSSPDAGEQEIAQTTAYRYVDAARSFLEANGLAPDALGEPLPTYVNLNDFCNAYYDPGAISINFFLSGGGCNNSAIDSVIAHEYGHFVDDRFGGIFDGGLSEGWGDTLACLLLKDPVVGGGITSDGGLIRTCDNDYVYPPGGFDESHSLGQSWAGFVWHARANLIGELGEEAGDALTRALVLPSFPSNAPDIPTAVREVFLRDDDDGDLENGTIHWGPLWAAAQLHGLAFALTTDVTPPGQATDLVAVDVAATSATVQFTSPGDDGFEGTPAAYEIGWSLSPLDDFNFAFSKLTSAPPAQPGGWLVQAQIEGLPPSSTVYVAMRAVDEAGNPGPVSNNVQITTEAGLVVFSESFESDSGGWSTDGLWHITTRRASEGERSFWYGLEETGNYDTGTTNAGTLTLPIIDLTGVSSPFLVVDQFIEVEGGTYYDTANVIVTDVDDPANVAVFPRTTSWTNGMFEPRMESLAAFADRRITIAFSFDTLDGAANSYEGWYVDNVRVIGEEASTCEHGKCVEGGPLDPACDPCVAAICAVDPFCCESGWDLACVNEVTTVCGETCGTTDTCGNGVCEAGEDCSSCSQDCGSCPTCEHEVCDPGAALDPACDPCAQAVCAADPYCCNNEWDRMCVEAAEQTCGVVCQDSCAHDLCSPGGALDSQCDPCVSAVCAADPYCCNNSWDRSCVEQAVNTCGLTCTQACSHDLCTAGEVLDPACDPCAQAVCAADPYCCNNAWDARCVDQAAAACGLSCGCSHDVCDTGAALDASCDWCVSEVCAQDPYCCNNAWDDRCVGTANNVCGLTCSFDPTVAALPRETARR
ncbi:hypothetical protein WMF04_21380 [Sorangium sp. So ce260]|uniref:hypothetical protein n=1 Tax=Sorangium sp. So ce260 TaxID=3133291 RepID=UPI003F5F6FA8